MADIHPKDMLCLRCGHPADWHRHDDADDHDINDPACPFRCIGYDCTSGQPATPCPDACPDFDPPPEYVAHWENLD